MDTLIEIDTKDVEYFASRGVQHINLALHQAQRELQNKMAFEVRRICITWGIPRVMKIRSDLVRASLSVLKASKHSKDVATLRQNTVKRFSGLPEEEFGGGVMHRHPATKAARGGTMNPMLPNSSKFGRKIIAPKDIQIAHSTGSENQLIAVFLAQLTRSRSRKPFLLPTMGKWHGGLKRFGGPRPYSGSKVKISPAQLRRNPNAKTSTLRRRNIKKQELEKSVITLRSWGREETAVRKRAWMRPSIDRWLETHDRRTEWRKACDAIITFRSAKGWDKPPATT
jgi:hypothetical protein